MSPLEQLTISKCNAFKTAVNSETVWAFATLQEISF